MNPWDLPTCDLVPGGNTPADFAKDIDAESMSVAKIVKNAKMAQ